MQRGYSVIGSRRKEKSEKRKSRRARMPVPVAVEPDTRVLRSFWRSEQAGSAGKGAGTLALVTAAVAER
jgi:hypothetical protein